jgi:Sec-independent protein secretion pathway component TatC
MMLLLVGLLREWVYRMAGGAGAFHCWPDFSLLIGAVVVSNIAYCVLCGIELVVRGIGRVNGSFGLDMWQFALMFSLVGIALAFFISLPIALGFVYSVPL